MRTSLLLAAAAAALTGCAGDGARVAGTESGATRILLVSQAAGPEALAGLDVYVRRVDVLTSTDTLAGDLHLVAEPRRRIDLAGLADGSAALLGESDVHFGAIAMVRLVLDLDSSRAAWATGASGELLWPAAGEVTLFAVVEQPLVGWASSTGDVVVELNLAESLQGVLDGGPGVRYLFQPRLRAVNAQATGRIEGTVRLTGDSGGPGAAVPGAIVRALRLQGDEEPIELVTTTRADASGAYALRYLNAGTYLVEAGPPVGGTGLATTGGPVPVLMGDVRIWPLVLGRGVDTSRVPGVHIAGATAVPLGDTVTLTATAFDASGDSVVAPDVQWTSRNPAIASVTGSGVSAQVGGEAVGTTWVVASWLAYRDSLVVNVVTDTTGGGSGGGPVATVTIVPGSAVVSVGDSLGFYAELRDSAGVVLSGRAVTWTVSDSTVVEIYGAFGPSLILRARAAGTATVTAVAEGKAGSAGVTVN